MLKYQFKLHLYNSKKTLLFGNPFILSKVAKILFRNIQDFPKMKNYHLIMFRTTKNNKTNPKNTDNFNILCRPFESLLRKGTSCIQCHKVRRITLIIFFSSNVRDISFGLIQNHFIIGLEMFYLNSTLNFGIPQVLVFQLEVYYELDRLLTGLIAQS